MTTRTGFGLMIMGLLLALFGVGGVENSITNTELLSAVAVAVLGLALMWAGTLGIRNGELYDE